MIFSIKVNKGIERGMSDRCIEISAFGLLKLFTQSFYIWQRKARRGAPYRIDMQG